jgi:sec-independent protein translocase protein TatB
MFGMGGSEIIVILIVALLFLGPDKLPDAAKQISKGIRDLKKQSRVLQQQIENDEHIGGAIRDLKSALRGDDVPVARPKPRKAIKKQLPEGTVAKPEGNADAPAEAKAEAEKPADDAAAEPDKPSLKLPATAGEANPDVPDTTEPEELAALIKPASGTVAKTADPEPTPEPTQKHG